MNFAAIIISILALLFIVFSFWWMNWRKGSLITGNIRTYAAVSSGNTLLIELPLIFFNPGAMPILVENLRLVFPDYGGEATSLFFNATVEKLSKDEGRTFATPFPVHGGKAMLRICEFQRLRSGFTFEAQNYALELQALLDGVASWKTIKKFELKVKESQLKTLNSALVVQDNEPQLSQA